MPPFLLPQQIPVLQAVKQACHCEPVTRDHWCGALSAKHEEAISSG